MPPPAANAATGQAEAAVAEDEVVANEADSEGEPYAPETPPADMEGLVPAFRRQLAATLGVLPAQVHIRIDLAP